VNEERHFYLFGISLGIS